MIERASEKERERANERIEKARERESDRASERKRKRNWMKFGKKESPGVTTRQDPVARQRRTNENTHILGGGGREEGNTGNPLLADEFRVLPFVTPFSRSKVGRNPFPPPSSHPGGPGLYHPYHHPLPPSVHLSTLCLRPSASPDRKPDTLSRLPPPPPSLSAPSSSPSSRYGSLNCFSPVDPIKDYGETIVACANIPLPPSLSLSLSSSSSWSTPIAALVARVPVQGWIFFFLPPCKW